MPVKQAFQEQVAQGILPTRLQDWTPGLLTSRLPLLQAVLAVKPAQKLIPSVFVAQGPIIPNILLPLFHLRVTSLMATSIRAQLATIFFSWSLPRASH